VNIISSGYVGLSVTFKYMFNLISLDLNPFTFGECTNLADKDQ